MRETIDVITDYIQKRIIDYSNSLATVRVKDLSGLKAELERLLTNGYQEVSPDREKIDSLNGRRIIYRSPLKLASGLFENVTIDLFVNPYTRKVAVGKVGGEKEN